MSASLVTTNFNLPIYAPNDITSWLTDFNGAMQLIDSALLAIRTIGETAETDVTALEVQVNQMKVQLQTIEGVVNGHTTEITNIGGEIAGLNNQLIQVAGQLAALSSTVEQGIGKNYFGVLGPLEDTVTFRVPGIGADDIIQVLAPWGVIPTEAPEVNVGNETVTTKWTPQNGVLDVGITVRKRG